MSNLDTSRLGMNVYLGRIADVLEKHYELAKEDLAFRREQAAKGDQVQAALTQMFLGPAVTGAPPAGEVVEGIGAMRRKRRES